MNRAQILSTAEHLVTRDRAEEHGDMPENFRRIAGLWGAYLGVEVKAHDVAAMMILLKMGRARGVPDKIDNWTDAAGYAACGGEIAT